jgi:hypothetical protein
MPIPLNQMSLWMRADPPKVVLRVFLCSTIEVLTAPLMAELCQKEKVANNETIRSK